MCHDITIGYVIRLPTDMYFLLQQLFHCQVLFSCLQGFAEPLHRAESIKRKALHITHIDIQTMYIDKHATLDTLHFQPDAKILKNPVY